MKKWISVVLAVLMMTAMMLPVAAATEDFVPSIEIKPGPGVVEKPGEDGSITVGEIVMPDGSVVPVPEGALIITPYAEKDDASEETKSALEEAFSELSDATSLDQLVSDLKDVLKQLDPDVDVEDLVVTDLFHVEVIGEYSDYIAQGGVLKITYEVTDDFIVSLIKTDAWKTLFGDSFVDNGDGTITVSMSSGNIVAFLKNVATIDVDPDNPGQSSPVTGDNTAMFMMIAVAFVGAAVLFFVAAKKQKA